MKGSKHLLIALFCILLLGCNNSKKEQTGNKPNVVIIFLDDSGYSDFNPFTSTEYPTPNVDKLASQGCCYTNFHVPQGICSASRASLLTGCYPHRTKVFSAIAPKARGLNPEFFTLAEVLKNNGYSTALFGKWHLGDQPETRPAARGFDETSGIMYSNDMWRYHPENPEYWGQFPLKFWKNNQVEIEDVGPSDQKNFTSRFTADAVKFINDHKDHPFFLYVPHPMPHVPLFCSQEFEGKSGKGLYADVIMELDWSVGEIMKALHTNKLDQNTIVILTSDNGPWLSYGNHAGSTPFREGKATSFEGGNRSACIIRYDGKIKANTRSNQVVSSIDLFPTLCALTGTQLPAYEIDGENIWPILSGEKDAANPHEYYIVSTGDKVEAILSADGKWKLHLKHIFRHLETPGADGKPGQYVNQTIPLSLYDMENDPGESSNVIDQYPDTAKKLESQLINYISTFNSNQLEDGSVAN